MRGRGRPSPSQYPAKESFLMTRTRGALSLTARLALDLNLEPFLNGCWLRGTTILAPRNIQPSEPL
jgi:hypothetical protein